MRKFVCMFNTDAGAYNGVYEQIDGELQGYGSDGILELLGMDVFAVLTHFADLGECVEVTYERVLLTSKS